MRVLLALPIGSLALLLPQVAVAGDEGWDGGFGGPKGEHRADFAVGTSLGFGVGNAAGYPNAADKIGVERHRASTGFGAGPVAAIWLGGALADWLNVGVGYSAPNLSGGGQSTEAGAFILRGEVFPLLRLGGPWVNLGVQGSFGLGVATLKRGDATSADGGSMSHLSAGLFHESFRFGGFALGPTLDYSYLYSTTMDLHAASAGLRVAFYAGP